MLPIQGRQRTSLSRYTKLHDTVSKEEASGKLLSLIKSQFFSKLKLVLDPSLSWFNNESNLIHSVLQKKRY